jgi:hypothetical protein
MERYEHTYYVGSILLSKSEFFAFDALSDICISKKDFLRQERDFIS